ncbi:MAG: hypothetical protein K2L13_01515 [Opitutales bacterium]|nr:hypothetical protein [Opitutales bacterium]
MRELGEILNLGIEYRRTLFLPFRKTISQISGNIRNKSVVIFSSHSRQSPNRIVAQIQLQAKNDISFYATKKRLGYSFLRVLSRDIVISHNPILDRKILFRCNNSDFADELFRYEEICEKFDNLFSDKFNTGIFTLGESSVFYYEKINFLTKRRRMRFKVAVDLMCDLLDVLYFYNKRVK